MLENEKEKMIKFLELNVVYKLIQINYQKIIDKREPTVNDSLYNFYFKKDLYQRMLGKTFIISPLCFYQVNYSTAKLMFSKVIELFPNFKKYDILLDLCCGKGGDLFKWQSANIKKVLGIDFSKDNIYNRNDGACIRYINMHKKSRGGELMDVDFVKFL